MRNNQQRILDAFKLFSQNVQNSIQCQICQNPYNLTTRAPWNICRNCHNICLNCKKSYLERFQKCHACRTVINPQNVFEDRNLKFTIQRQVRRVNGGQNILLDVDPQPSLIINMSSNNSLVQPLLPPNPPPIINPSQNNNPSQIQPQIVPQNQPQRNSSIDEQKYQRIIDQGFPLNILIMAGFQTPFMICNFIYAYNCDPTPSIDNDYGVGMTIRDWLFSSAYWGLAMHIYPIIVYFYVIVKTMSITKVKVIQNLHKLFAIIMILKQIGYNFMLTILWADVTHQDAKDLDLSIYQYIVWFLIIYYLLMLMYGLYHIGGPWPKMIFR